MGILPDENGRGGIVRGSQVDVNEPADTSLNLRDRLVFLLARFDVDDKEKLARQVAELLELEANDSLAVKAREVLGQEITAESQFRLEILERLIIDRRLTEPDDLFPDDVGAPKTGL